MVFVTGGNSQGKLDFVKGSFHVSENDIADGADCAFEEAFDKPVLNRLHLLVKRMMDAGAEPDELINKGVKQNPGIIILCDELGCGIVPLKKEDRDLREKVGRLQCNLAGKASAVYRVCCGIGTLIKGK